MSLFKTSGRRLMFGAAAIGIGALALHNSNFLDSKTDRPGAPQALTDIIPDGALQDAERVKGRVVEFAPSEEVQRRFDRVNAQLTETARDYAAMEGQLQGGEIPETTRHQAAEMLRLVEDANAELNKVNAHLLQEFVEFVDAQGQGGFVLIDFYDRDCHSCQELDENLAAGVAVSDYNHIPVIKAQVVEYEALRLLKRTNSYPELQLLRVSDFQVMGIGEGAMTPQDMASFINKAVEGRYIQPQPQEPEITPGI